MMPPQYHRTKVVGHPRGAKRNGWVHTHVLVAEQALGKPLPAKAHVHHVDEDSMNPANSNLVICEDMAYHKLLHYRTRIVRAGGNPNTDNLCSGCDTCKPLEAFAKNSIQKSSGRRNLCRDCSKIRFAEWRAQHQPALA